MDLLKTTVHLLHGQTDNCLTKIDRLFQDSPTEGVGMLHRNSPFLSLPPPSPTSYVLTLPLISPSPSPFSRLLHLLLYPLCLLPFVSFFFSPPPSPPHPSPASLIELLAEVLDAEMSLFGKRVLTVEEWLKRYLKVRVM